MLEIKSGWGVFNQEKYEEGRANIMLPIDFRRRIIEIQKRFKVRFKTYAIYVLLDRAYIANMERMFSREGSVTEYSFGRRGRSDNKKGKFRILPFNKSYFFADVIGAIIKKGDRTRIKAKPIIEEENGSIMLSLDIKPSKLRNVNTKIIKRLVY